MKENKKTTVKEFKEALEGFGENLEIAFKDGILKGIEKDSLVVLEDN